MKEVKQRAQVISVRMAEAPQRVTVKDYIAYGKDNLYPQHLIELLTGTALLCVERKAQFIEGNGFNDLDFYRKVINPNNETVDHILAEICMDLSAFSGFALLVNYNGNFKINSVTHVPFEKCRQGVPDDADFISKIFVVNRIDRMSKTFGLKRTQAEAFDVFNPDPGVVAKQIAATPGGITQYKGQILYAFHQKPGSRYYPKMIDLALATDIEAELAIKKSRKRDITQGYSAKTILTYYGDANPDEVTRELDKKDLADFVGEEGASILHQYAQNKDAKPDLDFFQAPDASERYRTDGDAIRSSIMDHFAIPTILYGREVAGKLGTSEEFEQAVKYVQRFVVNRDQRLIEREFKRLFSRWHQTINKEGDYRIENLTIEQAQAEASQTGATGTLPLNPAA